MKKLTVVLGIVTLMSSCGIQFGDYERWKEINQKNTCQIDEREYEFISAYEGQCHNCDEID